MNAQQKDYDDSGNKFFKYKKIPINRRMKITRIMEMKRFHSLQQP